MLIFVHGEDSFRSNAYVRDQLAKFKAARDPGGYNTRVLVARETDGGALLRELSAAPFLAERRMLVIKDILSVSDTAFLETFVEMLEQGKIPESTVLLVWQSDVVGRSAVVKKIKAALLKAQFVQEFSALKGGALEGWIGQEVQRRGGKIMSDAGRFLAENTKNTWEISTTIDMLVAYAAHKIISEEMVRNFVPPLSGETVFSLVEAIVSNDQARALRALNERRLAGDEDGQIFGMLAWQLRLVLSLNDFCRNNPQATSAKAAAEIGVHPFVAQKNWTLAQKSSRALLCRELDELVMIDRQFKTGVVSLACALERFIAHSTTN